MAGHQRRHTCSHTKGRAPEQPVAETCAERAADPGAKQQEALRAFGKKLAIRRFCCSLEIDLKCMLRKDLPLHCENKVGSDVGSGQRKLPRLPHTEILLEQPGLG